MGVSSGRHLLCCPPALPPPHTHTKLHTQPNRAPPPAAHPPEMDYDATDPKAPKGEVLLRGPCMFDGYYKAPDKTAEVGGVLRR
jgi:long-subunit acyl-CoA synthetase (AMP-forming)